jgi:putative transcriptional regulator
MTKKAYDKIAEGLNEALAIAEGRARPARLHLPEAIDVREIRVSLALSQEEFARTFGFSLNQIRDWEQGRSRPLGGVRSYLSMIATDARGVKKILNGTVRRQAA